MLLFSLCLNPLLRIIDDNLPGVQTGNHSKRAVLIAYADDATVILRSPAEVPTVQEALRCYEAASVAKLNMKKSAAMALGPWDTTQNVMGIPYHDEMKILDVRMAKKNLQSATKIWATLTGKMHAQTRDEYCRNLSLDKRILYVHNFLHVKAWYMDQLRPPPPETVYAIKHGGIVISLKRRHLSSPIVHTL
jgi:hypothetical protein